MSFYLSCKTCLLAKKNVLLLQSAFHCWKSEIIRNALLYDACCLSPGYQMSAYPPCHLQPHGKAWDIFCMIESTQQRVFFFLTIPLLENISYFNSSVFQCIAPSFTFIFLDQDKWLSNRKCGDYIAFLFTLVVTENDAPIAQQVSMDNWYSSSWCRLAEAKAALSALSRQCSSV